MYQEIMSRPASPGNRATGLGASGTRLRNDSMRRARARILPRSQGPFGIPSRSNGMISRSLRRRESGAPGVVASRSVLRHPCHIGCRSKRLHPGGHLGAIWLKNSRQSGRGSGGVAAASPIAASLGDSGDHGIQL